MILRDGLETLEKHLSIPSFGLHIVRNIDTAKIVAELLNLINARRVLDCTYGVGRFYKFYRPEFLVAVEPITSPKEGIESHRPLQYSHFRYEQPSPKEGIESYDNAKQILNVIEEKIEKLKKLIGDRHEDIRL